MPSPPTETTPDRAKSKHEKRKERKMSKKADRYKKKEEKKRKSTRKNTDKPTLTKEQKILRLKSIENDMLVILRHTNLDIRAAHYRNDTSKQRALMSNILSHFQKTTPNDRVTLNDVQCCLKVIVAKMKRRDQIKKRAMNKIKVLNTMNKLFPWMSSESGPDSPVSGVSSPPWTYPTNTFVLETGKVQHLIKKFHRRLSNSSSIELDSTLPSSSDEKSSVKQVLRRIRWSTSSIADDGENIWTSEKAHELASATS